MSFDARKVFNLIVVQWQNFVDFAFKLYLKQIEKEQKN